VYSSGSQPGVREKSEVVRQKFEVARENDLCHFTMGYVSFLFPVKGNANRKRLETTGV